MFGWRTIDWVGDVTIDVAEAMSVESKRPVARCNSSTMVSRITTPMTPSITS